MDWQTLNKTRVKDLRKMMKEHLPNVTGILTMKKEEVVARLAEKLEIEKPHKHVFSVEQKASIKGRIKALKGTRQAALESHDHAELKKQRRSIHRLKRRLRRMAHLSR